MYLTSGNHRDCNSPQGEKMYLTSGNHRDCNSPHIFEYVPDVLKIGTYAGAGALAGLAMGSGAGTGAVIFGLVALVSKVTDPIFKKIFERIDDTNTPIFWALHQAVNLTCSLGILSLLGFAVGLNIQNILIMFGICCALHVLYQVVSKIFAFILLECFGTLVDTNFDKDDKKNHIKRKFGSLLDELFKPLKDLLGITSSLEKKFSGDKSFKLTKRILNDSDSDDEDFNDMDKSFIQDN